LGSDLSHVPSSLFPRVLLADGNLAAVESLARTFGDRRLDFDYEICTSHDQVAQKLFRSPKSYQLIISSVRLAEINNFFLLKHSHTLQPFVPFVITAGPSERNSSRRALEEGAFDLISTPLEYEQTVSTIRLGLWHQKVKALIASRDKVIDRYRHHLAHYPGDKRGEAFRTILTLIKQSFLAHEQAIDRIEACIKCIANFDQTVEQSIRERALERLDSQQAHP
jgi:CheY-like chemotaxis protein